MTLNISSIRLTDETLREGESHGFHPQDPDTRVDLVERIHEITGIRYFGIPDWTATNVLSECDRATVARVLDKRGSTIPEDIMIRLIGSCGWNFDKRAAEYLESLPASDRAHFSIVYVITGATEPILRPQEGLWVLEQQGRKHEWRTLDRQSLFEVVGEASKQGIQMFSEYGVHDVILGIGDAFRADLDAVEYFVDVGIASGVDSFVLFDTVGVATPVDVDARIRALVKRAPGKPIRVHFHNDLGMATANTVTALAAGAGGADITVNGMGNRAGNANAAEVLMSLRVAYGLEFPNVDYKRLRELSRHGEQYFGVAQATYAPVTGRQVSVLQASIERTHIIETVGERDSYIAYEPEAVGDALQAAHGPASGIECVKDVLRRHTDVLKEHGITVDDALLQRTFAWVENQRELRAKTHKPRALAAIETYEHELRASYVTDDDIIAELLATAAPSRTVPASDNANSTRDAASPTAN